MIEGKNAKYGSSFTFLASKFEGQFYTYNNEFVRKRLKAILDELEGHPDEGALQFQILDEERKAKFKSENPPDGEFKFVIPNKKAQKSAAQDF